MLKFKALYKKMMDDLKDSGMWLEWAKELEQKEPEVAKFLYTSAKDRITNSFPQTIQLFNQVCEAEKSSGGNCLKESVEDHLIQWHEELEQKLKKF